MTQPTTDNSNKHATPLTEFVGSIFTELNTKWDTADDNHCQGNPYCWKDALIPIFVRLYQIAKTDNTVYWWILQCMSKVDLFKDGNEDIRKSDVFFILSELDAVQSKTILENSGLNHYAVLQTALENEDLASFRTYMPQMKENNVVYDIANVLKRLKEVRDIYEKALAETEGDDLGRFFYLVRKYMYYFRHSYDSHRRACDGMMYNVLLDVFFTQYREDKELFCDTMTDIGDLWVRSIALASMWHKDQIPQSAGQLLHELLRNYCEEEYDDLQGEYENCDTEEQKLSLMNRRGGCLDIEKYTSYASSESIFKYERAFPPFSCERVRHEVGSEIPIPSIYRRRRIKANGTNPSKFKINLDDRLDTTAVIPMEELKAVATSEDVQNVQEVPEKPRELMLSIPGKIKLYKDDNCAGEYETISLNFEKKALFLKELAVVLSNGNYFFQDAQESFIHAFDSTSASSEFHSKINWMESAASLFALCYVLFDEEITGKWPIIANLFVVKGKSLDTSNASKFKKGTNRRKMQKHVKEALENIGVVQKQK